MLSRDSYWSINAAMIDIPFYLEQTGFECHLNFYENAFISYIGKMNDIFTIALKSTFNTINVYNDGTEFETNTFLKF